MEKLPYIPLANSFGQHTFDGATRVLSDKKTYCVPNAYILQEICEVYAAGDIMDIVFVFRDYGICDIFQIGFTLIIEIGAYQYAMQDTYCGVSYKKDNQFCIHIIGLPKQPITHCSLIINWISYGDAHKKFFNQAPARPTRKEFEQFRKLAKLRSHCAIASDTLYSSKKSNIPDEYIREAWTAYESLNQSFLEIQELIDVIQEKHTFADLPDLQINNGKPQIRVPINCYFDKGFYSTAYYAQRYPIVEKRFSGGKSALQCIISVDKEHIDMLMYLHYCTIKQRSFDRYLTSEQKELQEYLRENHPVMQLQEKLNAISSEFCGADIVVKSSVFESGRNTVEDYYRQLEEIREKTYTKMLKTKLTHGRWVSEFKLYLLLKIIFPDAEYQYSAAWLEHQIIDIFIPSINCAVEYQGTQHYEAVEYFGGGEKLDVQKNMDNLKRERCKANNIQLLEWPYLLKIQMPTVCEVLREYAPHELLQNERLESQVSTFPINSLSDLLNNRSVQHSAYPGKMGSSSKTIQQKELRKNEIRKYDKSGQYICSYESLAAAAEKEGLSVGGIGKVLYGERQLAGGFQWRRCNTNDATEKISPAKPAKKANYVNQSKRVYQVAIDGEIIAEYDSINMAAKQTGINRRSISDTLCGKQKTAGGYMWVYRK